MENFEQADKKTRDLAKHIQVRTNSESWTRLNAELRKDSKRRLLSIVAVAASFVLICALVILFNSNKLNSGFANYQIEKFEKNTTNSYDDAMISWVKISPRR